MHGRCRAASAALPISGSIIRSIKASLIGAGAGDRARCVQAYVHEQSSSRDRTLLIAYQHGRPEYHVPVLPQRSRLIPVTCTGTG